MRLGAQEALRRLHARVLVRLLEQAHDLLVDALGVGLQHARLAARHVGRDADLVDLLVVGRGVLGDRHEEGRPILVHGGSQSVSVLPKTPYE